MPAESAVPPVTFGVKVYRDDGPGGHVHFDLFAGRNAHARGRSGSLVLRHDEFHAFLDRLKPEATFHQRRLDGVDGYTIVDEAYRWLEGHGLDPSPWQRDVLRHYFDERVGGENTDG